MYLYKRKSLNASKRCSLLKSIQMWGIFHSSLLRDTSQAMGQLQRVLTLGIGFCCAADALPSPTINARSQTSYTPVAFGVGTAPIIDGLQTYSGSEVTLSPSAPILTLDYGADVAGFPYFEVTSFTGSVVQVELKYSEQFQGLGLNTGDGPL
jgi:hypothetical protein